jgi:hypothetical protein
MIQPLRRRHRAMICALSLLLPVAFVAGMAARLPVPVSNSIPVALDRNASNFATIVWTRTDLWPDRGRAIHTTLRRTSAGTLAIELTLEPSTRELAKPDVLVYWAAGEETVNEGLPNHAALLGAWSNAIPFPLPRSTPNEIGRFVLYSLANHEVVAVSQPVTLRQN